MVDKVRVTVNLTSEDTATLQRLAAKRQTTVTDILRQAIAWVKFVDAIQCQGGELVIRDADDSYHHIIDR